jgi:hypothetical protein
MVLVAAAPVPVRLAVCVEPVALSATLSVAVSVPVVVGVKVTTMLQFAAAASVLPQVVVSLKEEALVPVSDMEMPVRVALPGLESVMVCDAEEVATVVEGKVSEVGARTASGVGDVPVTPVPVRMRDCG